MKIEIKQTEKSNKKSDEDHLQDNRESLFEIKQERKEVWLNNFS